MQLSSILAGNSSEIATEFVQLSKSHFFYFKLHFLSFAGEGKKIRGLCIFDEKKSKQTKYSQSSIVLAKDSVVA